MIRKNKKFIDPRYLMDEKMEIVSESGAMGHSPGRGQLEAMRQAGLDASEINFVTQILDDQIDSAEFLTSSAYEKLFEYFAFSNEGDARMPYGTAKARDGMPDEWILDHLQGL